MVRAPCCDNKAGLKKGPWTPEEDRILISHVLKHGHSNWRALPKQAGLLRCGKSCRLRWINYLRPDIKRGNFTKEEEDTIFELHEKLGNRWSAIAARLPGRTDNEIKNVWHTHLKKKLKQAHARRETKELSTETSQCDSNETAQTYQENLYFPAFTEKHIYNQSSPEPSSIDLSSLENSSTAAWEIDDDFQREYMDLLEAFPQTDRESFWSELPSVENSSVAFGSPAASQAQLPPASMESIESGGLKGSMVEDGTCVDFWYNLFVKAGGLVELPEP